VSGDGPGILFVDDELENIDLASEILREVCGGPVEAVTTVEQAVARLHDRPWALLVMDLFIPLGTHPHRVLGPRARQYQAQVEHLGGLVLLEEIERLREPPLVVSHTACTDHVLLELFGTRVVRRIPKPAPLDTLLKDIMDVLGV
jgi:CheY-like chemotaxis protein